jgi:hypothetical protein
VTVAQRAEIATASAVALIRLAWPPPYGLWRDWILVLALYWAVLAWDREGRRRAWASVIVALYLFAVHAVPQVPMTIDHLRLVL